MGRSKTAKRYLHRLSPRFRSEQRVYRQVEELARDGQVLEAFKLLDLPSRAFDPPIALLVPLATQLQQRGYLRDALETYSHATRVARTQVRRRKIRKRSRQLASSIQLLEGRTDPETSGKAPVQTRSGVVLHVVKQTIGNTQSGYTIRTHRTAVAQSRLGHEVHVVGQYGFGGVDDNSTWKHEGIVYHHLAGPAMVSMNQQTWFVAYVRALESVVRDLRPEILHAASNHIVARAARLVGRSTGIPVVYEVRGFWEETAMSRNCRTYGWESVEELERKFGLPDYYRLHQEAEKREWLAADAVITLAPVMKEKIVTAGVQVDDVHIVPNAIDPHEFEVVGRSSPLLNSLGFSDATQVVGYVSSLVEYEGIDDLIRAFAILRERRSDIEKPIGLLIVGDGADRTRLEAVADEVGRNGVVFTGKVPHEEVVDHYGLIDVFVVPRRPVPVCELVTPLKPYEALALGRALIMSDVAALAGIAGESGGALLAEAGNPHSFADRIEELLDSPQTRDNLAQSGRAWVTNERTWAANARLYDRVYASVL